jgi:hypothetical protein
MYLLDANTLIEAKNDYYRFNVAPGYWNWIQAAHKKGLIASIPQILGELNQQDDELSEWANKLPSSFWIPEDDTLASSLQNLADWTMNPNLKYSDAARSEFLSVADYRLVAAADAGKHVVVTREQSAPDAVKRIKLPDACLAMGVEVISPFDLYSAAGLVLGYQTD